MYYKLMKLLLSFNANINCMCEKESLLHHAVKNVYDTDIYEFLLEKGINPYLKDSSG